MTKIKPLVAGNWKMNGLYDSLSEIENVKKQAEAEDLYDLADVMFCLPTTLLGLAIQKFDGSGLVFGGQDCHAKVSGAHTGDISAQMLRDIGAQAVIVGHSERRADHAERSQDVAVKAQAAHDAGLIAIVCIGETAGERAAGLTLDVVKRQLHDSLSQNATEQNTVVAYEPVWAIGTGLTPTVEDVAEVHSFLRNELSVVLNAEQAETMKLLYGGSVKPGNAKDLMAVANVNGALVGGASLKSEDFLGIIASYKA